MRLQASGIPLAANSTPRQVAQQLLTNAVRPSPQLHPEWRDWHDWLLKLEALRYASPAEGQPRHFKQQLATLHSQLKYLHWPK